MSDTFKKWNNPIEKMRQLDLEGTAYTITGLVTVNQNFGDRVFDVGAFDEEWITLCETNSGEPLRYIRTTHIVQMQIVEN